MSVGQRIRARREELGWTRKELAKRTNIHERQIYRYEADENEVGAQYLSVFATALGTTTDWLVGRTDSLTPLPEETQYDEDEVALIRMYRQKSPKQRDYFLKVAETILTQLPE